MSYSGEFWFSSFSVFFSIFHVLKGVFLVFHIFSYLVIFQVLQCAFIIFHVFNISCHISLPKEGYSHFLWFSVFSQYSMSYNVHFSFFTFFSDFFIFQVLKWMFLIFHDFQCSCQIPCPTVDISHFPAFSGFLAIFHVLQCVFLILYIFSYLAIFQVLQCAFKIFPCFSIFLVIFHYLNSVIHIFRDFQFSCHIPGPTVCISHFSRFSLILSFFKSSSVCFSFSMIFSFLAIFHVL